MLSSVFWARLDGPEVGAGGGGRRWGRFVAPGGAWQVGGGFCSGLGEGAREYRIVRAREETRLSRVPAYAALGEGALCFL